MDDWWNRPMAPFVEEAEPEAEPDSYRPAGMCPWCSAVSSPDATCCPSCGAVMAQREDLGGLAIPGVTILAPSIATRSLAVAVGGEPRVGVMDPMFAGLPGSPRVDFAARLDAPPGGRPAAQDDSARTAQGPWGEPASSR